GGRASGLAPRSLLEPLVAGRAAREEAVLELVLHPVRCRVFEIAWSVRREPLCGTDAIRTIRFDRGQALSPEGHRHLAGVDQQARPEGPRHMLRHRWRWPRGASTTAAVARTGDRQAGGLPG